MATNKFDILKTWLPRETERANRGELPTDMMLGVLALKRCGVDELTRLAIASGDIATATTFTGQLNSTTKAEGTPYDVADAITLAVLAEPLPFAPFNVVTDSFRGRYYTEVKDAVKYLLADTAASPTQVPDLDAFTASQQTAPQAA